MLREREYAIASSRSRRFADIGYLLQMDVVHWNQHPLDVSNALPHSRRHAANLTAGLFGAAVNEARVNDGYIDAVEAGMLILRERDSANTLTCSRSYSCSDLPCLFLTLQAQHGPSQVATSMPLCVIVHAWQLW
jgi:hypothetical protein